MLKSEILRSIRAFLLVFVLFSTSLASYSQYESFVFDINGTNMRFLSANRTLIHDGGNNGHLAGSIWRYDNLISTHGIVVYGILTVKEIVNAEITDFDNEATGLAERFQPFIRTTAAGGYVLYELEFFETYTDQKVYISNYYLTSVDIDGREFVEIGGYSTYDVDETCGLTITHDNVRHLTRFSGITTSISNITFENTAAFVAHYVFPYTKVTFSLGSEIAQGERQYSVQFGAAGGVFSNPNTIRNPLKLMYLSKTANKNLFAGGTQRKYYIDIENVGGTADEIVLSDVLPAGITYVENSTKIVVPAASVIETIADQFSLAQYGLNSGSEHWTTEWVESAGEDGSPSGGNITITSSRLRFNNLQAGRYIERSLDLHRADQASLTFDYPAIALSSGALNVQFSIDGNTFVDITTLSGTTVGSFTYNIPSTYFVENLTIRFANVGGNWASGRNISIDNVKFTYTYSQPELTKTNAIVGGTLIDGSPDNILTAADNIVLLPGVTARVSFDVDVDCSVEGLIENTAKLSCPNLYTDEITATHIAYANPYYINHDAVCQDGIVTISATGEDDGQVFRWYDAETGGNLLGTGNTFETPYIDVNTDYWVAFYDPITGCESGRTLVTAIVSTGITGTGQIGSVAGTAGQNGTVEISENGASASTSGSPSWSNPNNATGGNNNQRASVALGNGETSGFLDINFPDFNIPSGIDIKGITVSIDRSASGNNVRDNTIRLMKNGNPIGTNKALTTTNWPTSETVGNYGGVNDLWGTTWSGNDFQTLGLRIAVASNTTQDRTAYVDYVTVTVHLAAYGDDQSNVQFTITGVNGATGYTWTVPDGAILIHGQGSNRIFVDFNNNGQSGLYQICVTPFDACGIGDEICQDILLGDNINNEISGTVYFDPDGAVSPNKVNGTPISKIGEHQLYAILTTNSNSRALSSVAISPNGTYKFSYLANTANNFYRIYINTMPFGDNIVASAGLPSGAVFNGAIDNNDDNTLLGGNSTNGWLTVTAGSNKNNTNVNFGVFIDYPIAINDVAITPQNTPISGNLLTNDDPELTQITSAKYGNQNIMIGSPFSIDGIGVITINSDGSFTFIPEPNYIGDLPPINYTAKTSDGSKSASACLHISVLNGFSETSNNDPIAINDVYTVEIGETAVVNILANDSDPDGDVISLVGVSGLDANGNSIPISTNSASPTAVYDANGVYAGTAYIDANDNIVFVPDNSYTGNVPFNYTISDGNGGNDSAIAVISVVPNNGSNSDIYANDDSKIALQGTTITGDVSENDVWGGTNPEITEAYVNIGGVDYVFVIGTPTTIPNVGQITINADGTYTFIPDPNFVGTVAVKYTVENNEGNSDTATLNLTTIPIIAEPSYTITKTAGAGTYVLGDDILYTIVVENTGNVTLTNIVVADNDPSAIIVSGNFNVGTLLKGETSTIVVSHTVTQADIDNASFTNIVTLNGKDPNGVSLAEKSDTETTTFT